MTHPQPDGYLALPPSGQGKPVLVLHAWWGLNATIKAFCDRLAAEGFVAFAADLYHGEVAETIPDAERLGHAVDGHFLQARAEVAAAATYLCERAGQPGLAVIGFSLGASYALDLAVTEPERVHSVVVFYGSWGEHFERAKAAYLGHFAEHDPYELAASVDAFEAALKAAGRPAAIYRYAAAGHWFFEPDRIEAYDPEAASLAWERTLAFLRRA
jgi:carboxymethylenebutenolidase